MGVHMVRGGFKGDSCIPTSGAYVYLSCRSRPEK